LHRDGTADAVVAASGSATRLAAVHFRGGLALVDAFALALAVASALGVAACSDGGAAPDPAPVTDAAPDAPSGPHALWAHAGTDTRGAGGRSVHIDTNGDVVTLGAFEGRVDFGGGSVHATGTLPHPFVVRHTSDGDLKWTTSIGSPDWADATDLSLDADGNAYVVGRFSGSIDLVTPPVASLNAHDAFVTKLDRDGRPIWVKHLAQLRDGWNVADAFGVAADAHGGVYVSGAFKGALDFGDGHVLRGSDSPYLTQGFVAALDADGHSKWARQFGTVAYASTLELDSSSHLVVTGAFIGSMSLGGASAKSDGQGDLFVAELDESGTALWLDAFSAPGHADGWDVCVTPDDGIAFAGEYDTPMDFGGGPTPGRNGAFVARFDTHGAFVWSRSFLDPDASSTSIASVHGIACGGDGAIAITGTFKGPIACEDGVAQSVDGGVGIFIASLAPDGTARWTRSYADAPQDNVDGAIAIDTQGALVVTGKFLGTLDLDGATVQSDREDAFIAKLTP
jgi:hypothetical protein